MSTRRLRWWQNWRWYDLVVFPLLLPIGIVMAVHVAYSTWARALKWTQPRGRHAHWWWRAWWYFGYRGLYHIDWWMKERALR